MCLCCLWKIKNNRENRENREILIDFRAFIRVSAFPGLLIGAGNDGNIN